MAKNTEWFAQIAGYKQVIADSIIYLLFYLKGPEE